MHWQDIIIAAGGYIFIFALLPSVFSADKPALSSSLLTGSILMVYIFVYVSLGLIGSAISTAPLSLTWFILAAQKWHRDRSVK